MKYVSVLAKIKMPALLRQKKCRNIKGSKFICKQFDPSQCTCDLVTQEVGLPWNYIKRIKKKQE